MFNRFLNKRKILTVQTSLLIILVITVALVISTMLFYYKAYMVLTVHYRDQMFQESNITMNALSDNIDSIDSIYRLLISNDTIYGFMTSSSKKPSDYIAAEKQMTSILILNNIWEKNYLRSVYVYTNNKKKFYVSKEDNIITTEENAAVYRNLTEPWIAQETRTADEMIAYYRDMSESEYERLKEKVWKGAKIKNGIMKYHPAFIAQRKMQKELQNKGYNDIFIPNLMVLSPTYAEYKKALDNVNDRMCRELGLYYDSNYNLVIKKDNSK